MKAFNLNASDRVSDGTSGTFTETNRKADGRVRHRGGSPRPFPAETPPPPRPVPSRPTRGAPALPCSPPRGGHLGRGAGLARGRRGHPQLPDGRRPPQRRAPSTFSQRSVAPGEETAARPSAPAPWEARRAAPRGPRTPPVGPAGQQQNRDPTLSPRLRRRSLRSQHRSPGRHGLRKPGWASPGRMLLGGPADSRTRAWEPRYSQP